MNSDPATQIKDQLKLARTIAEEAYGPNPPPEMVAAILNAESAQQIGVHLGAMTSDLCRGRCR